MREDGSSHEWRESVNDERRERERERAIERVRGINLE